MRFFIQRMVRAVALLTVGGLALFVAAFGDRIRSMEFGGARIQLALNVKTSLKKAFKLRLSGNYEEAEAEIEFAFSQFVTKNRIKFSEHMKIQKHTKSASWMCCASM